MATPTLTLNWASGTLPSEVTHGGGANGTRWDASGVLVAASGGRLTYDPATLKSLGLLVEEARTNHYLMSQQLDQFPNELFNLTITANSTTSPDGTSNADTLVGGNVSGDTAGIFQGPISTPSSGTRIAMSGFAKPGNGNFAVLSYAAENNYLSIIVNASTGAITQQQVGSTGGPAIDATFAQQVSQGFWRFGLSGTVTSAGGRFMQFSLSDAATGTLSSFGEPIFTANGLTRIGWGLQFEAGPQPSSPIVTAGSTVARSADTATTTNATALAAGALAVEFRAPSFILSGATHTILQKDDGTANEVQRLFINASMQVHFQVIDGGVTQADLNLGTVSANGDNVVRVRWATNDVKGSLNGQTAVADASATMPTTTTWRFGHDQVGATCFMSTLSRVDYYTTLTDGELVGAIGGSAAIAMPAPAPAATGAVKVQGNVAMSLPAPALIATGQVEVQGALSQTMPAPALVATGTVTSAGAITGTASIAMSAPALAATGTASGMQPGPVLMPGGIPSRNRTRRRYERSLIRYPAPEEDVPEGDGEVVAASPPIPKPRRGKVEVAAMPQVQPRPAPPVTNDDEEEEEEALMMLLAA